MDETSDLDRLVELVRSIVGSDWDEAAFDPERETVTLDFEDAPQVVLEVDDGGLAVYSELAPYPDDPRVRLDFLAYLLRLNGPGNLPEGMRIFLLDDMAALTFVMALDDAHPALLSERLDLFAGTAAALVGDLARWRAEWADMDEDEDPYFGEVEDLDQAEPPPRPEEARPGSRIFA